MSDKMDEKPHVILCDMCTEKDRMPAQKTCMKCEISMCLGHLQAHLTTPVLLQTHPLTEPTVLCGTTKCPQHGKLLEYYCLDDLTCVCVSCAIEDQHRLHNMKTFSTAHRELMEKLEEEQKALQIKASDDNTGLEKWEKKEGGKLRSSGVRLIEAVTSLRDLALTSVQTSVSARMASIKTSKSSMQAAQTEKDTFRFLQMYSQVHQDVERAKAVDLRQGLEPSCDRDALVQELRQGGKEMMKRASHFLGALLTLVDPENHQELVNTCSDLIFEPKSLGPGMSLSGNKRKLFYSSRPEKCSATLLICGSKSTVNLQRWMVSFSENCDWTIGLCEKPSANNSQDEVVYGVSCKGHQLSSHTAELVDVSVNPQHFGLAVSGINRTTRNITVSSTPIILQGKSGDQAVTQPALVEVVWNFAASSLSFYSRIGQYQREEIITIETSLNNWDLVPFVKIAKENIQNTDQEQWKCRCGNNHTKHIRRDRYLSGATCSCGAVIPNLCTTEMVCEIK